MALASLVLAMGAAFAPQAAPRPAAGPALDYEYFKTRVQPVFLNKRKGNARCYSCHSQGTSFRLQRLSPGATNWDEEQTRRNYEAAQRLVIPGEPLVSRLAMHPLAAEAGGDPFHSGGKHWYSQSDPEWQGLAGWARTVPAAPASASSQSLDFQFYRTRVEPMFLKPREGAGVAGCIGCHAEIATRLRLQHLPPGVASWSEQESRANFDAVLRLVAPGEPLKSRLLLHPLAPDAGGDPTHTGGKFWKSQDDPEWKILSEWVRGGK